MRFSNVSFCAIVGALLVAAGVALPVQAAAAVYSPQRALPAKTIQEFLANPGQLLAQFPDGGPRMVTLIRDLAASDPSTLKALVGLLATANSSQATAIGTGLGQVALMAVKTDPAYANEIQVAIAKADQSQAAPATPGSSNAGPGSNQPKIGRTVTTKGQVQGVTELGEQPLGGGTDVYMNELIRTGSEGKAEVLFADHTNLAVGPVTEIRLDKFVYNPGSDSGTVVFNAPRGAFRFITGVQSHKNYAVKTPYATMGVRGTTFYVVISPDCAAGKTRTCEQVQVTNGGVVVTTISGLVVSLNPGSILSIDSSGSTQSTPSSNQPIVNLADLGPAVTNTATAAFDAVTGNTGIGSTGAGGDTGGDGGVGGPGNAGNAGGPGGNNNGPDNTGGGTTTGGLTQPTGSAGSSGSSVSGNVSPQ
jgi:hypothetical protein